MQHFIFGPSSYGVRGFGKGSDKMIVFCSGVGCSTVQATVSTVQAMASGCKLCHANVMLCYVREWGGERVGRLVHPR